jgi:hypothetical protein
LNDEQRQKYVNNAKLELIRFKEEHPELVNNPSKKSKSKKKKEKQKGVDTAGVDSSEASKGNKPKRPLNAFMLYASELREKFKADNPELKHPDNVRIAVCVRYCFFCILVILTEFTLHCLSFYIDE